MSSSHSNHHHHHLNHLNHHPNTTNTSNHPLQKKRVRHVLGFRDPNIHARKSEFKWGSHLGSGTYGQVTQCTWLNQSPPRQVAIKIVSKSLIPNSTRQISLLNRCLKLHHPHVCQLLDWFQSKQHIYTIMELAQGGELFDHAISHGPFSDRDTAIMINQVIDAMAYIHQQSIVHRDLKPENLFVRGQAPFKPPYDLVVADFGVAVYTNKPDGTHIPLNGICGSPGYTAPEVYRGQLYSNAVDIWAIGIITFILLSGRFPFSHLSGSDFLAESEKPIKFPKRFGITPEAQNFILACLQIDPSKRITAQDALDHPWLTKSKLVEDIVEQRTTTSLADTEYTRCELPSKPHPDQENKIIEKLASITSQDPQDSDLADKLSPIQRTVSFQPENLEFID
ncbi:hypothetical protein O181_086786 [Austropuccinia psidii MF-1]|uniref:Protein kinase domain-containing protein n=1 Tax=Austropuccinia psidii MF-1 TaxID=1389203 RepID=A0A9Q3G0E2_9BASI|nr:hypothetical protein [Austropuccinia psidii MF-1]